MNDLIESNLARTAFDDNVSVLTDSPGLLGISFGSSGVGLGLELMLLVRHTHTDKE